MRSDTFSDVHSVGGFASDHIGSYRRVQYRGFNITCTACESWLWNRRTHHQTDHTWLSLLSKGQTHLG